MADVKAFVDEAGLAVYNGLIRGDTTPLEDGSPSTGTSKKFARADHVHPHDSTKVDKVNGKQLSTEDYTTADKTKLSGIEAGAEANVQSDWNQTDTTADDYIKNKPTIPAGVVIDSAISSTSENAVQNKVIYTALEGKVQTTRTVNNKALSSDITLTASDVSAVPTSEKGQASGVATLDANGKVPSSQLPSYVDDVIESYPVSGATELSAGWLSDISGGSALTPEAGKIYVLMSDTTTYTANSQFRWGGSTYVKISDGGIRAITTAEIEAIVNS